MRDMDFLQTLKSFVKKRLSAAAEEICGTVEIILTEYEDEAFSLKQEIDHKRRQLDLIIKLHKVAGSACEEVFPEWQERNSSLVQEEPEPLQDKEEQEGLLLRPEERLTLLAVKSDEGENTETEPVASTSTEHMTTDADVEDCGTSQSTGDDQLLPSHCPGSDSDEEREVTRQDQFALNILKSHNIQGPLCFLSSMPIQGLKSSKQAPITSSTGNTPISCPDCGKGFCQTCALKMHITSRNAWEKPFRCSVCWKGFPRRGNLVMHMRSHTGEKPFSCTVCGKSFSQNSDLKIHMRIHTGEIPFKCTVCDKAFSQNSNLKKHMLIHTGEKAFRCKFCGKCFSQNETLKNHLRNQH